jgi:hypothetical protein
MACNFTDFKHLTNTIMKKLIDYIEKLEGESFEGWTAEQKQGYLTACISIKEKVKLFAIPVVRKRALTTRAMGLILGGIAFFNALFYFIKSMFC